MRVANERNSLLVLPAQVGNVAHCDWDEHPASGNAYCERKRRAEKEASISCDDAAGHCCDKDIYHSRKKLLACFRGRSQ